jgi:hypothetical protein
MRSFKTPVGDVRMPYGMWNLNFKKNCMKHIIKFIVLAGVAALVSGSFGCKKSAGSGHNPSSPIVVDSFIATSGGVGTEVLISGSNFSMDTTQVTVMINGRMLKVVNASVRQIMAVVPAKCGSGNVVVKIGADSGVSKGIFNYTFSRIVSTLAGDGSAGYADGEGASAEFNFSGQSWYRSQGIVVDDDLNVYVTDVGNACIRKIDSLGNVTTLAGNPGISGNMDGQGTAAQFSLAYDLALDAGGNLYTVDPGNWNLRKITPDGLVTTVGGTSQEPWTVAVDRSTGDIYYGSCSAGGKVFRMDTDGNSYEVIGGMNFPSGMKFDKDGNLYISVSGDQVIRRFQAGSWNETTIAGAAGSAGYVNGTGAAARFANPWGLAVDGSGNVYVAGNGTWDGGTYNPDQSIRIVKAGSWDVSTFAGSGNAGYVNAIGESAAFSAPTGVTVDKNGTVYVMDKNNNRVRKIISQ